MDSLRIRNLQMALSGCAEKRPLTDRCTRWHRYPVMGTSTWRARSDCVDSMGAQESDCRVLVIGRILKLRERKQLGKDSNFGQQTYTYFALKALDRINASIAMAVVLHGRDQGCPKCSTEMRAEQPWCVDISIITADVRAAGRQNMTTPTRDEARKSADTCPRGL